jgi:hypothetical protein
VTERNQRAIMRVVNKQERRIARDVGGVTQPQSGAGKWRKHDARSDRFLIENKTTTKVGARQITIKVDDIIKVINNAGRQSRVGLLQFDVAGRSFVIVEWNDFLRETGEG